MNIHFLKNVFFCLFISIPASAVNVQQVCSQSTDFVTVDSIAFECPGMDREALTQLLRSGNSEEIARYFQENSGSCKRQTVLIPWLLLNHTRTEVRKAAFIMQMNQADSLVQIKAPFLSKTVDSVLTEAAQKNTVYSAESIAETNKVLAGLKTYPEYEKAIQQVKDNSQIICLPYLTIGCAKALNEVLDLMSPRASALDMSISLLPVVKKVLTDPKFVNGAARAALKIQERIQMAEKFNIFSGDVFADLRKGYMDSGMTQAQAEQYSWDLLAFYSTRGASVDIVAYELFNQENYPLVVSLYVISAGMSYLDLFRGSAPQYYSYTVNTQSTCDHGRPYHFWMSAYFSKYLKNRGYSAGAAKLGSYLSGMVYEFGGVTWGREPLRPYLEETFSPSNNAVRINLAVNGAGTIFGLGPYNAPGINLSQTLEEIFNSSQALPVWDKATTEAKLKDMGTRFLYWKKLMGADAFLF